MGSLHRRGDYLAFGKTACVLCGVFTILVGLSRGSNCSGDPCMYGICLEDDNSSYSCYCIDGYTGINCEINWDDCWSDPCLNGGTCNDAVAAYNCTCAEGFVGVNCEQRYSECSNQPCLNNGTCLDYDGFTCQCPDGYSGDYCEIDASVCNDTICKNSGECVEGPGFSFFCRCPEGWTGRVCEQDVDECVASPCKNGGLCINVPASYTCACLFGYTGKDCDKIIVPCAKNPCENGAVCLLEDERPVCYCVPDYHGVLCELRYDDCESKFANCENGGTCIDGINSFTCACPASYAGPLCDVFDPWTTPSKGTEDMFTIEVNDTKVPGITSTTSKFATSSTTSSTSTSTSTITFSSVSANTTGRMYTRWYPFTETTTERSVTGVSGGSTTESIAYLTDLSSMYSTSKEATPTEDSISMEPKTFSRVPEEDFLTSTTGRTSMETTSRRSRQEDTTRETVQQADTVATQVFDQDTTTDRTSVLTEYTSTSRSHPVVTVNDVTIDATGETSSEKTGAPFTPILPSSSITEFLQNRSIELSTLKSDTERTSSSSTSYPTSPLPPKSSISAETEGTVTFTPLVGTTASIVPSSGKPSTENETLYTEHDQNLTTKEPTLITAEVSDCQGTSCTSPTPPTTRNDTECNCTQRGDDCRTGPSITRAAFSGKSYARQRVDVDITNGENATLRIFVRLRTRFKNGIILHVYFDDEKYALIYLELSSLKFQFSCGLETMLLGEIDSPIDNGYEVEIDMRFQYFVKDYINKCSARLLVNGTTAVSGEQVLPPRGTLPRQANLHVGGIPLAFSHYFSHVAMGFVGCMDSLKVNDIPRHFIYDSVETFQIEDCISFLCLSSPCQNFGACEEINGMVRCRCIAGYTGSLCERSACDDNPCSLGATCISSPGTGFVCVCPLGTHGLLCEEDTVIMRPSFSVLVPGFSSYVAYGISSSIKDAMELKLRLIPRTLEQISLIAYLGQSGGRRDLSDHLSITYVRGYIMLTWDLGSGVRRIFTSAPLSAMTMTAATTKSYKAHTLRVGRRGRDAWLAIDGIGNVTGRAVGSMTRLDVSPILYIGGHKAKNFETLPHDLPLHTGFSGCIFDIELRTENAIFPITSTSPATGRGVGECHRNECIRHSCKNGAVCLNHGATYSCICTKEWMGSDCSTPAEVRSAITASSCHMTGQ
ncbi:hypothetical protein KM043_014743 [Ampulex compressa]|nr:hypothetical protein KM043_014743 [Ampulex compressa]